MHTHDLAEWRHDHVFDTGSIAGKRSTRLVMWITAAMMVVEIAHGSGIVACCSRTVRRVAKGD